MSPADVALWRVLDAADRRELGTNGRVWVDDVELVDLSEVAAEAKSCRLLAEVAAAGEDLLLLTSDGEDRLDSLRGERLAPR